MEMGGVVATPAELDELTLLQTVNSLRILFKLAGFCKKEADYFLKSTSWISDLGRRSWALTEWPLVRVPLLRLKPMLSSSM